MQPAIVITGASSGIGREFVRIVGAAGATIVLVARSEDSLQALAHDIRAAGGTAEVIPADLSQPGCGERIASELQSRGLYCDVLVNNAGFGLFGEAVALERQLQLDLIAVNVLAGTDLVLRFLPGMVERGRGRILNVSSVAAFAPGGPRMALYFASKAYLLSLSLALSEEVRGTGVTVTCLCPGPLKTPFLDRAGASDTFLFKLFPKLSARAAALAGWEAMQAGKRLSVPGFVNKFNVMSFRLVPRGMMMAIIRNLQRKRPGRA